MSFTPVTEIDCDRLAELLGYIAAFRRTPVVDDDFPAMRDRADQALEEATKIVSDARASLSDGKAKWYVPNDETDKEEPLIVLKTLSEASRSVLGDINDQQTGWYYQLQAATQKADKFVREHEQQGESPA